MHDPVCVERAGRYDTRDTNVSCVSSFERNIVQKGPLGRCRKTVWTGRKLTAVLWREAQ